jgi:hypothetical protein
MDGHSLPSGPHLPTRGRLRDRSHDLGYQRNARLGVDHCHHRGKAFAPSATGRDGGGHCGALHRDNGTSALHPGADREVCPIARGQFAFPSPFGTKAWRITQPSDGVIGHAGYSYWANLNNSAGSDTLYIMVSCVIDGPTLFSVTKSTGVVTKIGPDLQPWRGPEPNRRGVLL